MKPGLTIACFCLESVSQAVFLRSSLTARLLPSPAHADLVAHFRFDGDLKDATGQHNGEPVDAKRAPAFAPGRVGIAAVDGIRMSSFG